MNSINYKWYSAKVPTAKWNDYYSKIGYTFLREEGKETWIGFLAVIPPEGCLEITDINDLMKIQKHREIINAYPQPYKKVK